MAFVDREITCLDCAQPFTFTAGEQEFYERKGFKEEPKRCKPCREQRKARRNDNPVPAGRGPRAANEGGNGNGSGFGFHGGGGDEDAPGNTRRAPALDESDDDIGNRAAPGNGSHNGNGHQRGNGHGRSEGRGGGGGGGGRGGREMFDATCAQCNQATKVPFRPSPGRPVYCRDCYAARGAQAGR